VEKGELSTNTVQAQRIFGSSAPSATILIRLLVGWVFTPEKDNAPAWGPRR